MPSNLKRGVKLEVQIAKEAATKQVDLEKFLKASRLKKLTLFKQAERAEARLREVMEEEAEAVSDLEVGQLAAEYVQNKLAEVEAQAEGVGQEFRLDAER